jgi:uncharacterized protein YceK
MLKKVPALVIVIAVMLIIAAVLVAGCSSGSSKSSATSSGQATQPSTQQSTQQSGGQQQQPSGQAPDNSKMDAVMTRAAAILGVSADSFKKAFENAMGKSGNVGQPPSPPGDNMTAGSPPSQPSSGQQPSAPPSGSSAQSPDMTATYTKMATELNLTAEAIQKAMTQAQQELQK